MKIRIVASGEEKHVENSLGGVLVSAGLAVALSSPAEDKPSRLPKYQHPSAPVPKWEVATTGVSHQELVIRMTILGQVYYFSGNPKTANETVSWDGGRRFLNGFGREIPKEILDKYRAEWKSNPVLRGPEGDGNAWRLLYGSTS